MEVRINKEVRSYTEAIFFGLNPRQFVFSAIACVAALVTYFVASRFFNTEIVSWLCILAALPFGALGFITFQQMKTEDILKHFIYSIILQKHQHQGHAGAARTQRHRDDDADLCRCVQEDHEESDQ